MSRFKASYVFSSVILLCLARYLVLCFCLSMEEKIAGQPLPEAAFDVVRLPPVGSIIKMVNKLIQWPEIPPKAVLRVIDGKPLASAHAGDAKDIIFAPSSLHLLS